MEAFIAMETKSVRGIYYPLAELNGNICMKRGGVDKFEKAVLLLRDPYNSIWSEFQRRMSGSHVGGISRDTFDVMLWLANACNLANRYLEMWTDQYKVLEQVQ